MHRLSLSHCRSLNSVTVSLLNFSNPPFLYQSHNSLISICLKYLDLNQSLDFLFKLELVQSFQEICRLPISLIRKCLVLLRRNIFRHKHKKNNFCGRSYFLRCLLTKLTLNDPHDTVSFFNKRNSCASQVLTKHPSSVLNYIEESFFDAMEAGHIGLQ